MNNEPSFGSQPSFPAPEQPTASPNEIGTNSTSPIGPPVAQKHPSNVLAVLSFIAGILAVLSGLFFLGFFLGATAVILGFIAIAKKTPGKGLAIAGVITGFVGLITSVIVTVIAVLALLGGGLFASTTLEKSDWEIKAEQRAAQEAKYVAQKKDYAVGETAQFGPVQVKVNSVTDGFTLPQPSRSDYTNSFSYSSALIDSNPRKGERFVVANVTITNNSDTTQELMYFYAKASNGEGEQYTNDLTEAGGLGNATLLAALRPNVKGNESLEPGQSITGNMSFGVPVAHTGLKLVYTIPVYDATTQESTELVYTLAF